MKMNMKGAELASMTKSSVVFKSADGIPCEDLRLPSEKTKWWQDAKIGMFMHWGLYSLLGRGEWAMFNEQIPYEEYRKLAGKFNPENFDMRSLTGLAKQFGANYMVMVTRHHDGFALWDSKGSYDAFTSYTSAAKRDFVKEYVDACRADGLKVGLYYSPMDWRFPGYWDPKALAENAEEMKRQCYAQIRELCSNYGQIDILWYDGGWLAHEGTDADAAWFWDPIVLNKMVRSLQPDILINPRSGWEGDFQCDEGPHEITGPAIAGPWEKNMSISGSWAWRQDDNIWNTDDLIKMIVDVACRNGNMLLNVAPDKNGRVDSRAVQVLRETGAWLRQYGDSIYGTRSGDFEPVDNVYGSTSKGNEIFLHILDVTKFNCTILPPLSKTILQCQTFEGYVCDFVQSETGVKISIPSTQCSHRDIIIRIECR